MSQDLAESLLPRRYQEEVFAKAQAGNIIAALNTGSGKTLISLLLIRWISTLETSKDKVIIFLVPKVALVEQQGNFIAQNTPLRVIMLHGALTVDLADRAQWKKRFDNYDVFVMTAQIFLNILTHSIWSIDRVSLMIFDECHHARKNHPYNGIMREYFQTPATAHRPKIFGMTASPVWNPKDPIGSLTSLEANMDSKVIGVRAHLDELHQHSPKPVEIIKEYPFPEDSYIDFPSPTLWDCLQVFERHIWDELEVHWNALEMRYYSTFYNLGPYAASMFLHSELEQHVLRIHDLYLGNAQSVEQAAELGLPSQVQLKPLPADFWQIQQIYVDFELFFVDTPSTITSPLPISLTWCTPKVRTLVELLLAYHRPGFQGIVFVEQRQTATCLARILSVIPELKGLLRCGALMGQGVNSDRIGKPTPSGHKNTAESFRHGDINLLIATSVAEEGLDFPACDLVIRFDPLPHMVGYVQSRGRARDKTSTFIVMIQKGDNTHLTRYQALKTAEPEVNKFYQSRNALDGDSPEVDLEDDEVGPSDLAERERYVVESSGAVLTYDNSISLLNRLCSLIPIDPFTPQPVPKYLGDFEITIVLPSNIPLSPDNLTFTGPLRCSKKEARRAAAFMAVRRLHELDVIDDFLLPAGSKGKEIEDADGRPITDVSRVPVMLDILVYDPWTTAGSLWIHSVYINNRLVAGLVTGTKLPPVDVVCGKSVYTSPGRPMDFESEEDESYKRRLMLEFTRLGIWLRITARPFAFPTSLFLVPLAASCEVDFDAIELLVAGPRGYLDWSAVSEDDFDKLIIMNTNQFGRAYLLHNIRDDLTPMSKPPPGSREDGHRNYYEYFVQKWTRKRWTARVPTEGPLLEAHLLPRSFDGLYTLHSETSTVNVVQTQTVPNGLLMPRDSCQWFAMSPDVRKAYEVLPALCHRISDVYRAHCARFELGLPPIRDDLLVEALTLPCADMGYSNQRLETLGDAVLKLCTTVHLYNKYPHRHEGQLSILRTSSISNRFLLARAKDVGLETYVISEHHNVHTWRYMEVVDQSLNPLTKRRALRQYPRRSLQDCMEAIIGASFLTGGIPMALHTGVSLGVSFGGPIPWSMRYSRRPVACKASQYFIDLENSLGYSFHRRELLVEAVTHPSICSTLNPPYQRLEFLGDALLDLVVLNYLYKQFPNATSHQLSLPKAKAICSPSLASLAVRRLNLHQILLVNRMDLTEAIESYVPLLQSTTGKEIVERGWKYDPPKALSDVFESVMGAVLVDSAYNYDKAATVVEHAMEDVLSALSPSIAWDPLTTLRQWIAEAGCSKLSIEKKKKICNGIERDGVAVLVHGTTIVGPIVAASQSVSRFIASERALAVLKHSDRAHSPLYLCDCQKAKLKREAIPSTEHVTKNDVVGSSSQGVPDFTEVEFEDIEDDSEVVTNELGSFADEVIRQ